MPFVEKNLDEFFTAENAESAEKRFTTEERLKNFELRIANCEFKDKKPRDMKSTIVDVGCEIGRERDKA